MSNLSHIHYQHHAILSANEMPAHFLQNAVNRSVTLFYEEKLFVILLHHNNIIHPHDFQTKNGQCLHQNGRMADYRYHAANLHMLQFQQHIRRVLH